MEDFGSAFTGQSATPSVDPAGAMDQWTDWLQRPGNRSAMLQMGLQMMQPVGIGQTAGGHIAQSIGAGGEAMARADTSDLKERVAEAKMQTADERLRISQQQADASTLRATSAAARGANRKVGGLTDLFKARAAREDERNHERQLERDARALAKQANDPLMDPNAEVVKQYKGKSEIDIREDLRAKRPKPKAGTASAPEAALDDGEDDEAPAAAAPPTQGARQAPDGNWYVPDPKRPGKYLRVSQ
jgi:hypothetical protein